MTPSRTGTTGASQEEAATMADVAAAEEATAAATDGHGELAGGEGTVGTIKTPMGDPPPTKQTQQKCVLIN
jgi:hypothetical protein